MSKPKTREELLDGLDTMLIRTIADITLEWGEYNETGKELRKNIRQAYKQIKALIQNQPEVDEEWIKKRAKELHEMSWCGHTRDEIWVIEMEKAKDFIHQLIKEIQPQMEISMKDIEGWADEIRERVTNHENWGYAADTIKDMVEEEFGIKVKK